MDKNVGEKQFQSQVRTIAGLYGWLEHVVYDSRHSPSGWPDVTLLRDGHMVCLELKSENGRVTPTQKQFLDELNQVPGIDAGVYRPSQLQDIADILSRVT